MDTSSATNRSSDGKKVARRARDECVLANLRRATRQITRIYDKALQPAGLKITQFSLLGSVMGLGTPTIGALAENMIIDRTTLTRNLDVLQTLGYVIVREGPDRREREVALTKEGVKRLIAAYPLWQATQKRVLGLAGESSWLVAVPVLRNLATLRV